MNPLIFRYIEGLQWVMHYYYSGVCSWGWFYDYHYAPRVSGVYQSRDPPRPSVLTCKKDFVGVDKMTFHFELGKPFRPFEQLMGVLPEASKDLVPPPYRVSMPCFFFVGWCYILRRSPSCTASILRSSTSTRKISNKI
jgi:5'-3' exoribonuclease 1